MNVIDAAGVSKSFGTVRALSDVTLAVKRGEIIGLLGVNGAGKSTFLKILLGLESRNSGGVFVLGMDPLAEPIGVRRRVGYLPERRALYDWMTVAEAIRFIAPFYPAWDAARAESYRRRFDLPEERKVGALSRGQYARLALLLTLGHDPELFVLDEPSYGLDPLVRRQFLSTILEVAAEGEKTVLLASHLMNEVERVADRVAIIHRGRLIADERLDVLRSSVKIVHAPRDFDVSLLASSTLRRETNESELTITVTGYDDALAARLPAGAAVDDLTLEDIFCEYAAAAEVGGQSVPAATGRSPVADADGSARPSP